MTTLKSRLLSFSIFLIVLLSACSKAKVNPPPKNPFNPIDSISNPDISDVIPVLATVSTYSGTKDATPGMGNNGAINARYYLPSDVVTDPAGNLYIADRGNSIVRKISFDGKASTIAGTGQGGNQDGATDKASFKLPEGIAIDLAGNLYIADTGNNLIRKISNGVVMTVAGSGATGFADGTGIAASFNEPKGIAVDKNGNIYVADYGNNLIRKITQNGVVSTFAGNRTFGSTDGIGTSASFTHPIGIKIAESGTIYVADESTGNVRKISSVAQVSTFPKNAYSVYSYSGLAIDAQENLYLTTHSSYIIKLDKTGVGTLLAGNLSDNKLDGPALEASFNMPQGLTVNESGNIYIADVYNNRIRELTTDNIVKTVGGNGLQGSNDEIAVTYNYPKGITIDKTGNLFVSDNINHAVRKITPLGIVSTMAGGVTGLGATMDMPLGIVVDKDGNVFVADHAYKILKITKDGTLSVLIGKSDGSYGSVNGPVDIATVYFPNYITVDAFQNIYFSDAGSHLIRKISTAGIVSTYAGSGVQGIKNGTAESATFNNPEGLVFDSKGNLYVAETFDNIIRKITPEGVVSTFSGSTAKGKADGKPTEASFNEPVALAIDAQDYLYVADATNHKIRMISPKGYVSTIAGSGVQGAADGAGVSASFNEPQGITIDAAGNLYVADTYNNIIRKITVQKLK